ncbi:RNA-dependent RNA polymerase [Entomophthora muscae mitovirus 8]|uniref:RNA-dependent RNA polymerase n=1 Tax=Entomophthora muscae mitovirus 8 TaxID=2557981 RepID=A0ABM9WIM4_9VIRU|nr:RNA-dependent RNA polymerase [Entomophthora muscae mitovirus 8]DAC76947.1 TPA_inf: RNA-dependent RNA polymerase [Entomophthora muscae mitovirus 8]
MLYAFLSGRPVRMVGYSQYKNGLPRAFAPAYSLLCEKDPHTVRYILSLLQVSRCIPAWKKPDLRTITDPGKDVPQVLLQEFASIVPSLLETFGNDINQPLTWERLHVATTMGPSGPSMLQSATLIPKVLKRFKHLFGALGAEELLKYMESIPESFSKHWESLYPQKHSDVLRRVSTVPDVDGKTRLIAILDYWSQSILKVYHKDLMSSLMRIQKIDMTFGQGIAPFGPEDQKYYSFDLTAATDRFPVAITEIMMAAKYGQEAASAWKEIMTGEKFHWKDKVLKYNRGQPMGAYSSWASFSLNHHMVVQWSALRAGVETPFLDYRLLGDDIVIRNDAVANSYLKLMEHLGVEISSAKTLISENSFEFAKRFWLNGEEVTGYPIAGLLNTFTRWSEFLQVTREASRRGYDSLITIPGRKFRDLFTSLHFADPCKKTKVLTSRSYSERLVRKMISLNWLWEKGADIEQTVKFAQIWSFNHSCNMSLKTLRLIIIESLAQIKANQLLDSCRTQVKTINGFITKVKQGLPSDIEIPLTEVPLIKALMVNFSDMQGQMEDFRELSKSVSRDNTEPFEKILFEELLIPEINPEILDSSRRALRIATTDKQMLIKGCVLLRNTSQAITEELSNPNVEPDEEDYH